MTATFVFLSLLFHGIGDYITQSQWMASNKTKSLFVATLHAVIYSLPFLLLNPTLEAWALICFSHAVIDHWALARYLCFAKNHLAPPSEWPKWEDSNETGYLKTNSWGAGLCVVADNILHIGINFFAFCYYPATVPV